MNPAIAYQPPLRPAVPEISTVYGPIEFRTFRDQLIAIDGLLNSSSLDQKFLELVIKERCQEQKISREKLTARYLAQVARHSALCLRANIARILCRVSFRDFCLRVADSTLLQWFLHLDGLLPSKAFGKSTSHRFEQTLSAEGLKLINEALVRACCLNPLDQGSPTNQPAQATYANLGLETPMLCDAAYFDTTVIKAPIHFPVDWVLLRDAARTLMKGTLCIRRAGLKVRMSQSPEAFMSEMNSLCMAMTAQRRQKKSKKARKSIFRQMKKLESKIAAHAKSHLEALEARRAETTLTEGQANVIAQRLRRIIGQLPAAIKQAHERIIGERSVANKDKTFSLYDEKVSIVVRGKADAEVEFGNKFSLVESAQGLILHYELHEDAPADSKLVKPCIDHLLKELPVKSLWSDRGMHSKANEEYLKEKGVHSGLCPKAVSELRERMSDDTTRAGMKRRANTEARVGIFKACFIGKPARGKSYATRARDCGWAVLTHNLWIIARVLKEEEQKRREQEQEKKKRQSRQPSSQAAAA
jgi:Transposase DDE domain